MIKTIKRYYDMEKEKRVIINTYIALGFGFFWTFSKIIISILTKSIFLFSLALFSIFLIFSRLFLIIGIKKDKMKYHLISSIFICILGIIYSGYNIRFLFGDLPTNYGMVISLAIAVVSFASLVLSIINIVKFKKSNQYLKLLKLISLIIALTDIMLTQMSLLMWQMPELSQVYNAYFAIAIGIITFIIGIINVIGDLKKYKKGFSLNK